MEFTATHSLILTTNYRPKLDETDVGTGRRVALVRFPITYVSTPVNAHDRAGDPTLRHRLQVGESGQHEAVLAWIVAGAVSWYSAGRVMPPPPEAVRSDTDAWRADADQIHAFVSEHVTFARGWAIGSRDIYEKFTDWLGERGGRARSDQTFADRFGCHEIVLAHGVEKARTSASTVSLSSRPGQGLRRSSAPVGRSPGTVSAGVIIATMRRAEVKGPKNHRAWSGAGWQGWQGRK